MDESVKVLVAPCGHGDQGTLDLLKSDEIMQVVAVVDDPSEVVQSVISVQPDIAVICELRGGAWRESCTFIALGAPRTKIVLVMPEIDAVTLEEAMLLGVRQVLRYPEDISKLVQVIHRLSLIDDIRRSEEFLKATDPTEYPRLIALSGAKGGVGKTTATVNLGVALAQMDCGRVVVWDAYSQFGDVANLMGIKPTRLLAEVAEANGEVDDMFILDHVVSHESGADVLLTSDKPLPIGVISGALTERTIRALRKKYRFIVADTPPTGCPMSTQVFSRCWLLLVVTTLKDVTSVSDAMRLISSIEPQYVRAERIAMVANRISRIDTIQERELESLVGKKVIASIPEDPQVRQANNMGRPISLANPKSPAARQLQRLAETVLQTASTFNLPSA